MITFKEYGDRYAINKGMTCFEDVYRMGLIADEIEEFTKGYGKLVAEAQCEQDENTPLQLDYTPIELI